MSLFSTWRRTKSRGTAEAKSPAPARVRVEPRAPMPPRAKMQFNRQLLAAAASQVEANRPKWGGPVPADRKEIFKPAKPMPGVVPKEAPALAMDSAMVDWVGTSNLTGGLATLFGEGLAFFGYPYLAELTQRTEYRRPAEVIATEMTRKWIKLKAKGDADKSDRITELEQAMDDLNIQAVIRKAIELDSQFGIGHIYPDTGKGTDDKEMITPLTIAKEKFGKGDLKGFRTVEPTWCYPAGYNTTDPLDEHFYRPRQWYVMGRTIDASRLFSIVSRPVPDILKPAYQFGGLALTQILKPYVDNWLRTRQSVSDLIASFSVSGILTNLGDVMSGGSGEDVDGRAVLFNKYKANNNLLMLDKESEEYFNISTPLGTLDHLQAQAQEQMASACGVPLIILLGITPSGLNATADPEIKAWASKVNAGQESDVRPVLTSMMHLTMLNTWGEIDEDITFEFVPLLQMTELEVATVEKTKADTHAVYSGIGAVDPDDVRQAVASDEASPYHGLSGPAPGPAVELGPDGQPVKPEGEKDPAEEKDDGE